MNTVPLGTLITPAESVRADGDEYPVLSITMREGLVFQEERFKKAIAGKDLSSYKVVSRGQLVVGFPIDEAVLDFQEITDVGIVSPAYGIWDVIDPEAVDSNYLGKYLRSPQAISYYKLRLRGTTARRRSLTRGAFEALPVPLPPLTEQKRIAGILNSAASTLSLAKEEAMKADESRSALFESVFPASNYSATTIGDFLSETQYGSSKKAGEVGAYPVLRMGNLSSTGSISYSDLKHLELEETEISKHTLQNRDVLFNRTNSKELVGKTAVYYGEDDQVAYAGYLIRCRTNDRATPEFISGFLNSRLGKAQLFLRAKAIVGMANINAQELRTLSIPDVPVEEQEKYASAYQQLEDVRLTVEKKIKKLEELQASISTRAFVGQL